MPKKNQYDKIRIALRDKLWPDAESVVWNRSNETGFITVPRTLTLVCALIRYLSRNANPRSSHTAATAISAVMMMYSVIPCPRACRV